MTDQRIRDHADRLDPQLRALPKDSKAAWDRLNRRAGLQEYPQWLDLYDALEIAVARSAAAEARVSELADKVEKALLAAAVTRTVPELRAHTEQFITKTIAGPDLLTTIVPRWKGIWSTDEAYGKDSLVAYAHGLWVSLQGTAARPGSENSGWKLILRGPR